MSCYFWKDVKKGVWCWHIHHSRLLELSTEPLSSRAQYIRKHKPEREVNLRLRLMRPVENPDRIPKEVKKAWDMYIEAGDAYDKAWNTYHKDGNTYHKDGKAYYKTWDTYNKAWDMYIEAGDAYYKAVRRHSKVLEELHRKECSSTCTWDGRSIC